MKTISLHSALLKIQEIIQKPNILILSFILCAIMYKQNVKLEYCPTDEMIADIMTKGLNVNKYEKFRKLCGVHDVLQVEKEC